MTVFRMSCNTSHAASTTSSARSNETSTSSITACSSGCTTTAFTSVGCLTTFSRKPTSSLSSSKVEVLLGVGPAAAVALQLGGEIRQVRQVERQPRSRQLVLDLVEEPVAVCRGLRVLVRAAKRGRRAARCRPPPGADQSSRGIPRHAFQGDLLGSIGRIAICQRVDRVGDVIALGLSASRRPWSRSPRSIRW